MPPEARLLDGSHLNLMNGDESPPLVTTRACFGPERLVLVPEPPPLSVCTPTECEPHSQPDQDVAEVVGESDAEGEQHADPDPELNASGCGSGPSGTAALIVGVLFSAVRRRWGCGS